MARFKGEADYLHGSGAALGILLINLGTPDAPTKAALRRYLKEFLWDPRVVEIPRPIWWLILHGVVLPFRPGRSAAQYKKIWSQEGSPLLTIARQQLTALRSAIAEKYKSPICVELGMRYGNPSILSALEKMQAANVRRLLVLPLYPQYSATTTASAIDAVTDELKTWRWIPEVRWVNQYHDNPVYIDALAASVNEHWQQSRAEKLLMSFHGLPKRFLLLGDPYHCMCQKTARLLAQKLQLKQDEWVITFQSRFGKAEWLQPYTIDTLRDWGKRGVKSVDVICPGFAADCLETLEEIKYLNRDAFITSGGQTLNYISALNTRNDHISLLLELVETHTQGWQEMHVDWNETEFLALNKVSLQQAQLAGAKTIQDKKP